jgi:hypothetical protein
VADREVNLNVNVNGGVDRFTPEARKRFEELKRQEEALRRLRAENAGGPPTTPAADLARLRAIKEEIEARERLNRVLAERPAGPPTPRETLSPERQRLRDEAHRRETGEAPAPRAGLSDERRHARDVARGRGAFGADDYGEALRAARAEREAEQAAEQRARMMNRARAQAAGGVIPEDQVRAAPAPGGPSRPVQAGLGVLRQVAGGLATPGANSGLGAAGQELSRMRDTALGVTGALAAIPAVGPVIAGGIGIAVTAVTTLGQAFLRVRDNIGDVLSANRQLLQDLREGRQTGLASPDALRRALTAEEQARFASAQSRGDQGGMDRVLGQAEQRHRAGAEEGGLPALRQAAIQADLEAVETHVRSTGYRLARSAGVAVPEEELRQNVLRRYGVDEGRIGTMGNAPLTQAQIREIAGLGGAGNVESQAGLEAIRNARRNGAPNLNAGGLNLSDLPSVFQSRQGDVLDMHRETQQESVRDLREEARFNRQMALWEEIHREIARANGRPVPPPPVA